MRRTAALLSSVVVLLGAMTGCGKDGPADVLADFLTGWRSGNLQKVGFVTAAGSGISADQVVTEIRGLSGDLASAPLVLTRQTEPKITGDVATSRVKLDWTLPGGEPWSYQSTVRLTDRDSDGWRVIWEPVIVHSELTGGDKLQLRRVAAERAGILDRDGKPIVTPRPVVTIGVTPQKVTDLPKLAADLTAAFQKVGVTLDLSDLRKRVDQADPGAFIDLITLRRPDYDKIRDDVRPLAGTVFREENRDLAPTREFARALLGTADPATAEDMDANPDRFVQGDIVGHGGLQGRYDTTLRGTPGQSVVIARRTPDDQVEDAQLFSVDPVAGTGVRTTLDQKVQQAADAALGSEKRPSSMVAIRISDSSVLAVANGPDGGTVNNALTAKVPPGSTFKMVSALGLLQKKAVTADTAVNCPKEATVSGRTFTNAHDMELGKVPFHTDFAESCNTAFVSLAPKLGADGMAAASTAVGLGGKWDLGIEAFSGTVSTGNTPVELAAASFGQGTTVVSPLAMAGATAAVARGRFEQPKLVTAPAPANPAGPGAPLNDAAVKPLRDMMREVVTDGTGTALKRVPGKPVFGKTGTAEFQTGSTDTHAWFIGWQGDVAFAVMVQQGGAGAESAIPIVARFLTALN
ncbi:penicillin-binding transpeptidase domain-containing protein [Mangrovihabitans endophyticus]|uniref:Penicillin-binding protein n=1 Tax=Mangrovihabitans endophyticus TaxID=1751298 RepID=A0A8J3FQ91_9ACTN|nr:penicillin-binding transpeptidase domain-containing protein [Mangrovihabitans endophyticus]GGK98956.1 penicillin-binding protein [Mangrovihabitans endophyticus]